MLLTWSVLVLGYLAICGQTQVPTDPNGGSTGTVSQGGGGGMPTSGGTGGTLPGGSGTGGVRPGGSSGGMRPGMPFLPMAPHAPNAIHHVGIAYNLLKGNPDGEYWSTGGEDPGVSLTRKIFTISPGDHPPEAIIEHHDGCQYSHGFSLFYNTKSYQDKLYINVQTSGAANDALKPYGFTLSSAYQAVAQQTSRHHYVFQDATTYCKIGHVRYSMNLAASDHYPVNREFAFDICNLPTTYDASAYMKFIEDWGTHVMTEVTIGKMTTNRYLGNLRDLFNFVMFNVTDEIKPGGSLNGYPESYVIDLDSFKYRHEYKYIVGVFEDMLTVGDMYYNDVIGKTLETIDMALDSKYWHWMSYYVAQNVCRSDAGSHLSTWQSNIVQALKAYPAYKRANAPAVQPLAMPATWPLGEYSLPKPSSGCPQGFVEGTVILPQPSHNGGAPTGLNLAGHLSSTQYELNFCTKENPSATPYEIYWPKGDYCILKYDKCPYSFTESSVLFSGLTSTINSTGVIPTTRPYYSGFYVSFCCRNDGVYSKPVFLPKSKPFYMYRFTHGCQTVSGMRVQDQTLTFYNSLHTQSLYSPYTDVSSDQQGRRNYGLHFCYYTALT